MNSQQNILNVTVPVPDDMTPSQIAEIVDDELSGEFRSPSGASVRGTVRDVLNRRGRRVESSRHVADLRIVFPPKAPPSCTCERLVAAG